jgi:hypothetical protein
MSRSAIGRTFSSALRISDHHYRFLMVTERCTKESSAMSLSIKGLHATSHC